MRPATTADTDNRTVITGRRIHNSEMFIAAAGNARYGEYGYAQDAGTYRRSSRAWSQTRLGLCYDTARPEILRAFHNYAHTLHNARAVDNRKPFLYQEHVDRERTHLAIVTNHIKEFIFRPILHRLRWDSECTLHGSGHEP